MESFTGVPKDNKTVYIGYWNDKNGMGADEYPMPVENSSLDNTLAIKQLSAIINHPKTRTVMFKGMSFCRCCGKTNGSEEHRISINNITYCIPEGYMHYLDVHKVSVDERIEAIFNYLYN